VRLSVVVPMRGIVCVLAAGSCGRAPDGGGFGGNPTLERELGLVPRTTDPVDLFPKSNEILEAAMPGARDLGVSQRDPNLYIIGQIGVDWRPGGLRETAMPPNPRGPRIYQVRVDLQAYLLGGDVVALVSFCGPDCGSSPDVGYEYGLDPSTADALLHVYYVNWPTATAWRGVRSLPAHLPSAALWRPLR
jgi:hypothetical protein